MLGKLHVSLSNRLLHLATTKLAIVLYFGYTVNTFWLGSGRLPVKLNYNECQQHITISFSKHEAQFSGKQPYAMFSHASFSAQGDEFSCCLRKKGGKRQSMELFLYVKKAEFVSVFKFTDRESEKILIFMKWLVLTGSGGDWLPWSWTYFNAAANTTKSCWRHQRCQSEGFQTAAKSLWEKRNLS